MNSPAALPAISAADPLLSNRTRWGTVWLMFLAAAINFVDRGSLSVAMPLIAAELNFSPGGARDAFIGVLLVVRSHANPNGMGGGSLRREVGICRRLYCFGRLLAASLGSPAVWLSSC